MKLRPRQYVLLAVLFGLIMFNLVRFERNKKLSQASMAATDNSAVGIWATYDKVAALRDSPTAQFQPAFEGLRSATASVPQPNLLSNASVLRDVRSCTLWLQFYRQSIARNPPDATWLARSTQHVDSCVQQHRDVSE